MKTHSGNLDPIPLERTYSELRVQRESVPTQPGLGTRVGKAKIRRGGHGGKRTRVQYVRLSQASSGGWAEQKEVKEEKNEIRGYVGNSRIALGAVQCGHRIPLFLANPTRFEHV